jgi:hypothetical protein
MADAAATAAPATGEAVPPPAPAAEPPTASAAASTTSTTSATAAAPAAASSTSAAVAPAGPPRPATGVVLFAGSAAHSMTGRKDPPAAWDGVPETNLYSFHVIAALKDAKASQEGDARLPPADTLACARHARTQRIRSPTLPRRLRRSRRLLRAPPPRTTAPSRRTAASSCGAATSAGSWATAAPRTSTCPPGARRCRGREWD